MNWWSKLVGKQKTEQPQDNELYQMLYRFIGKNTNLPKYDGIRQVVESAYLINEKIYSIVQRTISPNIGIPWVLYEVKNERKARQYAGMQSKHHRPDIALEIKEQALEQIDIKEVTNILKRPNSFQTFDDLEQEIGGYYQLTGNAYLYKGIKRSNKNMPPLELHVMPAHLTQIVSSGNPFDPVGGYRLDMYSNDVIDKSNVGHLKNWNPDYSSLGSNLYGMPPLRAAWKLVQQDNEALNAMYKAFINSGAYGILSGEKQEEWSEEQAHAVRKMWEKSAGSDNFRKLVFSSSPTRWTQIGVSPVDLAIIEARKMTLRDLCNVYKVPAQLFNDAAASTYNNMKEARKTLITDASIPLKESIRGFLQQHFIDPWGEYYGKKLYLDYDMNAYLELQDDLDAMFNRAKTADWISPNEKRSMTGFEGREEAIMDEPLLSGGQVPISIYNTDFYLDNEAE